MEAPMADNTVACIEEPHVRSVAGNNLIETSEQSMGNKAGEEIVVVDPKQHTEHSSIKEDSKVDKDKIDINVPDGESENICQPEESTNSDLQKLQTEEEPQIKENTPVTIEHDRPTEKIVSQESELVLNQGAQYMLERGSENIYMPEGSETLQASEQECITTEVVTEESQPVTYLYEEGQGNENYVTEESIMSETVFESEYVVNNPPEDQQIEETVEVQPEQTEKAEVNTETDKKESEASEVISGDSTDKDACGIVESSINDESADRLVIEEEQIPAEEPVIENENNLVEVSSEKVAKVESISIIAESVNTDGYTNTTEVVESEPRDKDVEEPLPVEAHLENESMDIQQEPDFELMDNSDQAVLENSDGTVVYIHAYDDISSEASPVQMDDPASDVSGPTSNVTVNSETAPKKRGRRSTNEIPLHVLGHDISKPVENGRAPKPRLGVKVPYRNLTSQIVSKEEIQREIVERGRKKQEAAMAKGDVLFARKLTQRLAKKIAPEEVDFSPQKEPDTEKKLVARAEPHQTDTDPLATNSAEKTSKIQDNSDLLAILEGDGEDMPVLPKEISQPVAEDSNIKMLEREIALQQLHDLPYLSPKQRAYRGRHCKETKAPLLTPEISPSKTDETDSSPATSQHRQVNKDNSSKDKSSSSAVLKSPKKFPIEIEPQIKVNMALKTYSRKRKSTDVPDVQTDAKRAVMAAVPDIKPKLEVLVPPDVYVTKSSRVIKKKVIWDPDEIPVRSPKSTVKVEVSAGSPKMNQSKTVKTAEKTEKATEKTVEIQKNIDKKPSIEKSTKQTFEKKSEDKSPLKKGDSAEKKSITSPASKMGIKLKKTKSEIDRLLEDEGAIKMLYDLKNNDEIEPKKKKSVISVEKTYKELIKKANEIKSELESSTSSESPKSLRKKETVSPVTSVKLPVVPGGISRQKSKDSVRSSVHTPPGSPSFSFPNAENTYLIRRRSSSSMSSGDGISDSEDRATKRKSGNSSDASKSKKHKKIIEARVLDEKLKTKEDLPVDQEKQGKSSENKLGQYKTFTLKKTSKHVTIDLNYGNKDCYCTLEVLEELTSVLKKLSRERDCNVVLLMSSTKSFCLGLDYKSLVSDKESERKQKASELALCVSEFLMCLLHFPKVLIAGIQGECIGLGVTMLPLFDIVVASDSATFSAPYSGLGTVAEGGFLLTVPYLTNHGLAAELLFTPQKLTADDAFRRGLVSKLCWPEKYSDTLKNLLVSVAKGSKQSLESTKKQLRSHVIESTEAAIHLQTKQLVDHWTSHECQKNFAKLNSDN